MKIRRLAFTTSLLMLSIQVAFSEKITVQDATEMALKNNKTIKIQMLEVEKSKIDVDAAWKKAYFSVDYTASAGRYFKDIASNNQSYSHSITLSQPIYTGGAIKSGIRIGKESLDLAELTLEKTKKEVILNTLQAYINVYDAENTLTVYKLSKEALDQNFKEQQAKYELRMVTRPEILEAERSVKEIEAVIISQEAAVEINKETLGNLIGMDGKDIEIVPFGVNEVFTKSVNLKEDLEKLKRENTEYQMMLKSKEISRELINIEKANLKPTVAGVITYGTLSNQPKIKDLAETKNYNGMVGINFKWNLFDWGAKKLEVEKAEKTYEVSNLKAEQTLDDLKVSLKNVYYKIQSLEKSLEALKTAVEVAEENYELEVERYSYRLITLNDLLMSERNLRQARTNYLSSRLNYYYLISQYGSLLD